jgi:hypothetical protein
MTQKDIDRLLAARKLVDAYRNLDKEHDVKAQCYADLTAAKTDSKISVTDTKAEIQRIEDKRDAATKTMYDELKELGFDTYSDFAKFNNDLSVEEFMSMLIVEKLSCDKCPTMKCAEVFASSACAYAANNTIETKEISTKDYLMFLSLSRKSYLEGKSIYDATLCPKGFGYVVTVKSEPQFNIFWRA